MPINQRTQHLIESDVKLYRNGAFSSEDGALAIMAGAAASCVDHLAARYGQSAVLSHDVVGQDLLLGIPRIIPENSNSRVCGHIVLVDADNVPSLRSLLVVYPNYKEDQIARMVTIDEDSARYLLPADPVVFNFLALMKEDSHIAQLPSTVTGMLEDTVVLEYIEDDEIVPPASVFSTKDILGFKISKITMKAHLWGQLIAEVRIKWGEHFFDLTADLPKWHNELFGTDNLDGTTN